MRHIAYDFIVYIDGSCSPTNPGFMGAGIKIYKNHPGVLTSSLPLVYFNNYYLGRGTNNRAEMLAAIMGLRQLIQLERGAKIKIISDSRYLVTGMQKHIYKWVQNNELGGGVKIRKNADLWRVLYNLRKKFTKVSFEWKEGKTSIDAIDVDVFAKEAASSKKESDLKEIFDEGFTKLKEAPLYTVKKRPKRNLRLGYNLLHGIPTEYPEDLF